jgi:hypothetical protein
VSLHERVLGRLLGIGRRPGDHPGRPERNRLLHHHDLLVSLEIDAVYYLPPFEGNDSSQAIPRAEDQD